jgi:signal transduction histidine kinase
MSRLVPEVAYQVVDVIRHRNVFGHSPITLRGAPTQDKHSCVLVETGHHRQQVLINLMLNGIEAMKDKAGDLTIKSKTTKDGILVSVSDVGIGFPAEDIERVFEAFFATKVPGTGMGLSVSRRIIESHGGRLWAYANSGRGATFHFLLPAAPSMSSPFRASL